MWTREMNEKWTRNEREMIWIREKEDEVLGVAVHFMTTSPAELETF